MIAPAGVRASSDMMMNADTTRQIILTLMSGLLSLGIGPASAQQDPLGQFEGHADIGAPALAGSASYDVANQEYTLTAAGTNMWFGRDQFHFLWKRLKGDFILRVAGGVCRERRGRASQAGLDGASPP